MPSYGRPERLKDLLDAPGGWPAKVIVLVNEDDPKREAYENLLAYLKQVRPQEIPWELEFIPAGSRCADAHRYASEKYPDAPYYGLLCDDHWPLDQWWHTKLVEAAADGFISIPNGENYPSFRSAGVLGGGLVRAMGTLVPAAVKHNYEDNIWDKIAEDFNLLRPVPEVTVQHKHWVHGTAEKDATYERGSADMEKDAEIYQAWLNSQERADMYRRIGKLHGIEILQFDPSKIKLAILVPIREHHVDVSFHRALLDTQKILNNSGISNFVIESTGGSHPGMAREGLLWDAWYHKDRPTHFMFIDSDMGWDPQEIGRLIAADHDFSGIVGVKKQDNTEFCFRPYDPPELHPRSKFLKAHDVGFAFVLLKANVIKALCNRFSELKYKGKGGRWEWALFLDMIEKGERLSEDLSFCARWRRTGGEIWTNPFARLFHIGRKEYTGRVADCVDLTPLLGKAA